MANHTQHTTRWAPHTVLPVDHSQPLQESWVPRIPHTEHWTFLVPQSREIPHTDYGTFSHSGGPFSYKTRCAVNMGSWDIFLKLKIQIGQYNLGLHLSSHQISNTFSMRRVFHPCHWKIIVSKFNNVKVSIRKWEWVDFNINQGCKTVRMDKLNWIGSSPLYE